MYDDNGTLKFGTPTEGDTKYQWTIDTLSDGKRTIQNVSSGKYVTAVNQYDCENNLESPYATWGIWGVPVACVASDNVEAETQTELFKWTVNVNITSTYRALTQDNGITILHTQDAYPNAQVQLSALDPSWGSGKWDFIYTGDMVFGSGSEDTGETYYNIQNSYYQLYMYEEGGYAVYGNVNKGDAAAQWQILEEAGTNNVAIQNKGTGHYLSPEAETDKVACIESATPLYLWAKEGGTQGYVFAEEAELENSDDGQYIGCLHMENKKGYVENSYIQKSWGTPQWLLKEYTEISYQYIKANGEELYLYEEANGDITVKALTAGDVGFYWYTQTQAGESVIRNRKTGHALNIEKQFLANDYTTGLVGVTGESTWKSLKWILSGEDTVTISSIDFGAEMPDLSDYYLYHQNGVVYANNSVTAASTNAQWTFENAPVIETEVTIPTEYVRLFSNDGTNYLYEVLTSHTIVYGECEDETDSRAHWKIEEDTSLEGQYRIVNRASGNYIVYDSELGYLKAVSPEECGSGDLWYVEAAEGTSAVLFRSTEAPLTYLNIGAGAGYAQSTLVSIESATTQWVLETANAEGRIPEGSGENTTTGTSFTDTNVYYAFENTQDYLDKKYLNVSGESIGKVTSVTETCVWEIVYEDGYEYLKNKETGVVYGDLTLAENKEVVVKAIEALHTLKAEDALNRENEIVFSVYAEETKDYEVTINYEASTNVTVEVKVNGASEADETITLGSSSKNVTLPLKKGMNTISIEKVTGFTLSSISLVKVGNAYRGASVAYTEYEAEDGSTNAQILADSRKYRDDIQSEASGRSAVKLSETGDYVEFVLKEPTNSLVVRYCIPDSMDGSGMDATLGLYADGIRVKDLAVTSKHSWVYGTYPWSNTPGDGKNHRFFDESRYLFDTTYEAGTVIRLQKDAGDSAAYYIIDLIDTEEVEAASSKPENALSITEYGAVADDGIDDTSALEACMQAAKAAGKEVFIPKGTFHFTTDESIDVDYEGLVIRGAGMWHTTLTGDGAGFMVKKNNVSFYDFSIYGTEISRIDATGRTGIESSNSVGNLENLTIQNVWMEHCKTGVWIYYMDHMLATGLRIRNTYADGMNLCGGTSNTIIEQNAIRNTGDDALALWSSNGYTGGTYQGYDTNNKIRYNKVGLQWLASSIALYGGDSNQVTDNIVHDTIAFGGGINISTNHSPVGMRGTVLVARNTLLRAGSHQYDYNQDYGAIWIYPVDMTMAGSITIEDNIIKNSSYQGISVIGNGQSISNPVAVERNVIDTCGTFGIDIASGNTGKFVLKDNIIRGNMINGINNGSNASFEIDTDGSGGGSEVDEPTKTIWFWAKNWDEVHVYTWDAPGEALGGWPGSLAVKDGDTNWYSITVPYDGNFNLIFTDGLQTKRVEVYIDSDLIYITPGEGTAGVKYASKEAAEAVVNPGGDKEPGTDDGTDDGGDKEPGTDDGTDDGGDKKPGTEDGTDDGGDKKPGTDDGTDDGKDKKTGLWAEAIADQTYTGAAIQVLPAVYDGEDLLTLNKDYTLKYQNNKAAGVATVIITGKGNYKGKYEVKFHIVPKDITTEGETLYGVLKSGKTVTVKPTVTTEVNGKTKKLSAKDYTATYNYAKGDAYEEAKAYSVTVTGKGNYTGSITYPTVFVTNKSMLMKNAKITLAYKSVDCDGTAKEPAVVVRAGGKEAAPESYSVAYTNNVYAGKATVTVTGDNKNLFGSKSVTFTIKGAALKKVAEMAGLAEGVDYTGKAQEPDFKVVLKADGTELTEGTDYEVTYKNNVKAGKATVIVEGKGAYEGKLTKTFRIHKVALGTEDVRSDATAVYTKAGAKAENVVVTSGGNVLVPGVDYKVSYKNNKKVGSATLTVTGMGGYSGKVTKDYTVVAADFAENVIVHAADAVTGTRYGKLKVTVTDNGKKLSKSEYSISYSVSGNDVSDGNAKVEKGQTITVTVTAKGGNYVEGSKAEDTLYVGAVNLSKAKVKVAPQVYTGEEVCPIPVEVKVGRDTLTLGEDYIITGYGNNINKSNKATITIQGIDDYCGSKTVTFKITERNIQENWNASIKRFLERIFQ